jgi:PRC-barrel domain
MKHRILTAAATAAIVTVTWLAPAVAQDASVFIEAQSSEQYLARDHLIGAKVYGKDGKIVADVEDLIINSFNQVEGVVLGTGGYFGFAEKKVGVALSALSFEEKDGLTTVSLPGATAESLAAAADFKRTKPAKSLIERAREKALELSDKTRASTEDAIEKAKPALQDAKEKAQETYEKAKEAAAPVIEKATDAAKDAMDTAKDAVAPAETPSTGEAAPAAPEETPATP